MATRMQQRRGTATMWTNANPILGVAEIGYETDTNKFKIGDGTNRWADLSYFVDLDTMIAGAPGLLNSLDEIAAAINDDPTFFTTIASSMSSKAPIASPTFTGTVSGVTKAMVGLGSVDNTADTAKPVSTAQATAIATAKSEAITAAGTDATSQVAAEATARNTAIASAISTEVTNRNSAITTAVAGVVAAAPAALDTLKELADALTADESTASTLATLVGTKASSAQVATDIAAEATARNTAIATAKSEAITAAGTAADTKVSTAVSALTKSSVGLGNVDNTSDANKPVSSATQTALDLKANTSAITELAQDAVNSAIVAGAGLDKTYDDTANTITLDIDSTVATKTYADGVVSDAITALTKSSVGLNLVDNTPDASKPISSNAQAALDLKAPLANPTFTGTVSGVTKAHVGLGQVQNTAPADLPISSATQTALDLKAPLASPTFTGTVSGVTKSHVGLGNVDNTSDAAKPVSTAQATAIAYAKAAAIEEILGAGVPAALNTLDELAAALGDDANYASTVTTALGTKAPLASPALTGNPTAPTQTVGNDSTRIATTAFVKAAIQNIASLNLVLDGGGV